MDIWQWLAHKLFGWDYVLIDPIPWGNGMGGFQRFARVLVDKEGDAYVMLGETSHSLTETLYRVRWVTCSPYKYLPFDA